MPFHQPMGKFVMRISIKQNSYLTLFQLADSNSSKEDNNNQLSDMLSLMKSLDELESEKLNRTVCISAKWPS